MAETSVQTGLNRTNTPSSATLTVEGKKIEHWKIKSTYSYFIKWSHLGQHSQTYFEKVLWFLYRWNKCLCRHVTTIWHYNVTMTGRLSIKEIPLESPRTFHMVQRAVTSSVMQYTLDIPFITWSMPVSLHQGFPFTQSLICTLVTEIELIWMTSFYISKNEIFLVGKLNYLVLLNALTILFVRYWNRTKLHEHLSLNREKDCKVLVYRTMFRIAYGPL